VCEVDGNPISVFSLELTGGRIRAVRVVLNPDKLHALAARHHPEETGHN
jgi:hypothetical protein